MPASCCDRRLAPTPPRASLASLASHTHVAGGLARRADYAGKKFGLHGWLGFASAAGAQTLPHASAAHSAASNSADLEVDDTAAIGRGSRVDWQHLVEFVVDSIGRNAIGATVRRSSVCTIALPCVPRSTLSAPAAEAGGGALAPRVLAEFLARRNQQPATARLFAQFLRPKQVD